VTILRTLGVAIALALAAVALYVTAWVMS